MQYDRNSYETFHRIIEDQANRLGPKPYIESIHQKRSISFEDMNRYCNRVANFLRKVGISSGDIVSLMGQNSIETLIIFFGVLKYGAIINPINSEESSRTVQRLIERVRPSLVIHDSHLPLELTDEAPRLTFHDLNSQDVPLDSFFVRLDEMQDDFFEGPKGDAQRPCGNPFYFGYDRIPEGSGYIPLAIVLDGLRGGGPHSGFTERQDPGISVL